ncbi:MAG: nitrous oxide reductase accessory protein NosL [bacterium]|nr:nitrous oxide reductase accessory protein NosL [bacterium]
MLGCKPQPKPEPLQREDICVVCKMAVSDQRFAAQAILPNGEYVKYDDIGCLIEDKNRAQPNRVWVGVFDTKQWVRGDSAVFVATAGVRTPMGFGFLAFATKQQAEQLLAKHGGKIITWSELVAKSAYDPR